MAYSQTLQQGGDFRPDLLSELILAIDQEIANCALHERIICRLKNGTRTGEIADSSVYKLQLNGKSNVDISDEELAIHISGSSYPVTLSSITNTEIEVRCKENLGNSIPRAVLCERSGAILRALKSKLEDQKVSAEAFKLAYKMFKARSHKISAPEILPQYSYSKSNAPNSSQSAAVLNSFSNSLAIIWGPPGAGKTKTIAQLVEAHLNAGRRILLLSNANAAVDVALSAVVAHLRDSHYSRAQLIRLGVPKNEKLGNDFPLVLPARIAELANAGKQEMVDKLLQEKVAIETDLYELNTLSKADEHAHKLFAKLNSLQSQLEGNRAQRQHLHLEYSQLSESYQLLNCHASSELNQRQRDAVFSVCRDMELRVSEVTNLDETTRKLIAEFDQVASQYADCLSYKQSVLQKMGLLEVDIANRIKEKTRALGEASERMKQIGEQEPFCESDAINNARLVACTLAKMCYQSPVSMTFDVVIVDEASMAPPALLFWAACFANTGITLVGDFKQLPPVSSAKSGYAKAWFASSIFDRLRITEARAAWENPLVTMLDTQYRMNPQIAQICNDLCYGGYLQNGPNSAELKFTDELADDNCLVLIDTSKLNPGCSPGRLNVLNSSRINMTEALIARHLISLLQKGMPLESIGVASPYGMQAEIITELTKGIDPSKKLLINTVHKFQGGEKDLMIFTAVDGPGKGFKTSMLNHKTENSSTEVLLNVAISRARKKLYFIANVDFFKREATKDALILRVIDTFERTGKVVQAEQLDYLSGIENLHNDATNEKPSSAATRLAGLRFFDDEQFWPAFYQDMESCSESLDIVTGFVGRLRSEDLLLRFEELRLRGVRIRLFTRPPDQHGSIPKDSVSEAFSRLKSVGVQILVEEEAHQKAALIDRRIAYHGSLNIMSHTRAHEQMLRLTNEADIMSLVACLNFDRFTPFALG